MPPKLNALALKQRFAALSQATSFPSPSSRSLDSLVHPNLSSSSLKRKLSTAWNKRDQQQAQGDILQDDDTVQDVLSKIIFQAGVDYETKPMVVINASALPDPRNVSYDVLLARSLAYLNLYVESDYTVIFFAAGGRHTPGWNWVWKAYRSLSRKYRKNLKQLYIVHSTFFTKMLFSLAGAMISPKFFRKIIYIQTLSALASHVPITQIDIPPAVYQENLKHETSITLPVPTRSNTFGVPLEQLMGHRGEKGVPKVVRDCIQFLRETGLHEEGLFRRSPQSTMLRAAQEAYDRGNVVSLHTFNDPHIAAVLLKKFFRDLPEPIFPERLYPMIQMCPLPSPDPTDTSSIQYIQETVLPELAPCACVLLSHVFRLMYDVTRRSSVNRMDAHNLAVVLCPNLVKGQNPARDVMFCAISPGARTSLFDAQALTHPSDLEGDSATLGMVVKLCIERYFEIFGKSAVNMNGTSASSPTMDLDLAWITSAVIPMDESATVLDVDSLRLGRKAREAETRNGDTEEEEEIDDAMLVMPIGPSQHGRSGLVSGVQNIAGNGQHGAAGSERPSPGYKVRQKVQPRVLNGRG
ncbi:hypothetical protein APHAL10511_004202 [Amanita phalloides]|nr:hypothetical protein APHAL10511_004202 [Amanita phalloides]